MTYTTTDLATHTLRALGVIDATETPASEDQSYVESVYAAKWEELSAHGRELTYWNRDAIPRPVLLILRDLMMLEVAAAYGQPLDPADKQAREDVIIKRLRRHVQIASSGLPTEADYF